MIRTIISDIGNVLSGFTWYDFYKSKGYSEEMVERLAKATVKSDAWKEYDRGVLSEEEIYCKRSGAGRRPLQNAGKRPRHHEAI